jgi:mannan endo-1,6-alpha-mannosidase
MAKSLPTQLTLSQGNDDQAFWGFAAMSAAEMKFPNPDPKQPQWLALAQAVFNRQAGRWDSKHCGGGLRWQFNPLNNGFMEKNTISNGCFFQLAARLARYTKNETYADWAVKTYDWMVQSPLISKTYEVYDSFGFTEDKCNDQPGLVQWSYNIGTMIAGTAFMYNHTNGDPKWKDRLTGYLNNAQKVFFPDQYGGKTMVEYACETQGNCNKDQRSFKAYLSRWLAVAAQLAPYTQPQIMPWLQTSASAAVKVCSGGPPGGIVCGRKWYETQDDGTRDIGNQMTALSIVQANLIKNVPSLADHKTGTSTGDASAGNGNRKPTADDILATRKITTGDKVGAWIITTLMVFVTMGWVAFLLSDADHWDWIHLAYDGGTSHQWYGR